MRARARMPLAVIFTLLVSTVPAHAVGTITSVKNSKAFEWTPAGETDGTSTFFAWSQDILAKPRAPISAFFQIDGGAAHRINPGGTYGYLGDFDEGTSALIYQQVTNGNSDLRLFDVDTRVFGPPLGGINNAVWQWSPAMDTAGGQRWILYGENRFARPTSEWRVMLYNTTTQVKKELASATNRCGCIFPGDISYPWVVWSRGLMGNVWRYNIQTDIARKVVLPSNRDEYYASVTSDGTVYMAQAGDKCGSQARLYRVDTDGTPTLLFALPAGQEPLTLKTYDTGAGVTLFADRYFCRVGTSNIFKMEGADTVTFQGHAASAAGDVSLAGRRRIPASARPG